MPRLIVIKGADKDRQFELSDAVLSVGRDASNQIRLHDHEVSRRHAEFRAVDDEFRLTDVGSANGTFVNNQPIKDVALSPGDHIRIGQSILVYSPTRTDPAAPSDLANRISMISRQDLELTEAIVKTVGVAEGTRILPTPTSRHALAQDRLANRPSYETIRRPAISRLDLLSESWSGVPLAEATGAASCQNPDNGRFIRRRCVGTSGR